MVSDGVRRQVLTAEEIARVDAAVDPATAFSQLWVVKEAMVKAGLGTLTTAGRWPALATPRVRQWSGGTAERTYVGAWLVDR